MHRIECAFEEIFKEAIRVGGTITGEHGIGIAKKQFLPDFAGEVQMRVLKEVGRRAFDPHGILNPGKYLTQNPSTCPSQASTPHKRIPPSKN